MNMRFVVAPRVVPAKATVPVLAPGRVRLPVPRVKDCVPLTALVVTMLVWPLARLSTPSVSAQAAASPLGLVHVMVPPFDVMAAAFTRSTACSAVALSIVRFPPFKVRPEVPEMRPVAPETVSVLEFPMTVAPA